jgi:hypothetical protein
MKNPNNGIKKETDSLKVKNEIKKNKIQNNLSYISDKLKKEKKINIFRIIINCIFSVFILALVYFVINNYEKKYYMAYYLTIWTFFMNGFYIVSVTAIDLTRLIKNTEYCVSYNNFVRKHYIRICFPFSLSIVFLFWMLILLGDEFQFNSRDLMDFLINFCFHGLQFVFLLYDTLSYPHQVSINKLRDFIIISIITAIYFVILGLGKYAFNYQPYDFMTMSNVRQIAGAAILIYIAILDGYVVFILIAGKCFINKTINMEKLNNEILNKGNIKDKKNKENKVDQINEITKPKCEVNCKKENIEKNNNNNDINNKIDLDINNNNKNGDDINDEGSAKIIIDKDQKKKLKPIQLKRND